MSIIVIGLYFCAVYAVSNIDCSDQLITVKECIVTMNNSSNVIALHIHLHKIIVDFITTELHHKVQKYH